MESEQRLSRRTSFQGFGQDLGTNDRLKTFPQSPTKPVLYSHDQEEKQDEKEEVDEKEDKEDCFRRFSSCRWVIGYMCCAARFSQSAIRQCIGMAVVCMSLQSGKLQASSSPGSQSLDTLTDRAAMIDNSNHSSGNTEVRIAEFTWSPEFEGLILNAFNIGFFFSPILGGYIAGSFGGKRVVLVALLVGSVATICLPLAAKFNDIFFMVLRILAGIFLGAVDPAIQALWARWAPQYEKAKLTTCSYTGLSLAGIVTFFISGQLCGIDVQNGWPFIFYFFGGFAFLCTIPWMFLVYDSPDQHPRILDYEKRLIAKGKGQVSANKLKTPWKQMLTSGPFWAIVVAHITYTWVTSWMMAYMPKYLNDVMKFDIDEDGLYSSLPYAGRLVAGFLSSYLSDRVSRANLLSTGRTRKLFQTVGCVCSAGCTLAVGFLDHTARGSAVALLVLAMSFQNLTSVAFRINHLDIAPRFAGVMMGMTVTAAMGFSLTGPPITAAIIRDGTQKQWLGLFIMVASLNIIGAVVFDIFASGEVQTWALPPKANDYKVVSVVTISNGETVSQCSKDDPVKENGIKIAEAVNAEVKGEDAETGLQAYCGKDTVMSLMLDNHFDKDARGISSPEDPTDKTGPLSGNILTNTNTKENMVGGSGVSSNTALNHSTFAASDTESKPSLHNSKPSNNMLRKRISFTDLQMQDTDSKVKQNASSKPSLPTHLDKEVNRSSEKKTTDSGH